MCRKNESTSPCAGKSLFSERVARDSSVRRTIRAPAENNCYRAVAFRSQAIKGRTPPSAVVIRPDLSGSRRLSNPFLRPAAPLPDAASMRKSSSEEDRPAFSGQGLGRRRPLSRTARPIAVSRSLSAVRPLFAAPALRRRSAFFRLGFWRSSPRPEGFLGALVHSRPPLDLFQYELPILFHEVS